MNNKHFYYRINKLTLSDLAIFTICRFSVYGYTHATYKKSTRK